MSTRIIFLAIAATAVAAMAAFLYSKTQVKSDRDSIAKPASIVIEVRTDGTAYWKGKIMNSDALQQLFRQAARQNPPPTLHVRGSQSVDFKAVEKIFEIARSQGMRYPMGYLTEPDN